MKTQMGYQFSVSQIHFHREKILIWVSAANLDLSKSPNNRYKQLMGDHLLRDFQVFCSTIYSHVSNAFSYLLWPIYGNTDLVARRHQAIIGTDDDSLSLGANSWKRLKIPIHNTSLKIIVFIHHHIPWDQWLISLPNNTNQAMICILNQKHLHVDLCLNI